MITAPIDLDAADVDTLERLLEQNGHGLTAAQVKQTRVALKHLRPAQKIFQPRNLAQKRWEKERHIDVLAAAVRQQRALDRITVFPVAGFRIVVDGHCRLAAYRRAGFPDTEKVPVRHISGSLSEALAVSASANSKNKLPLTLEEKTEHAWRLVLFSESRHCYSLRRIATISGVGKSTVHNMTKTLAQNLPFDPRDGLTWSEVRRQKRGDQEVDEAWEDRLADEWAERLHKEFGDKPNSQPDVFKSALERAYPRLLPTADELEDELREELEEDCDF